MVLRYVKIGSLVQDSLENVKELFIDGTAKYLFCYKHDWDTGTRYYYQVPTGKKFIVVLVRTYVPSTGLYIDQFGYVDDLDLNGKVKVAEFPIEGGKVSEIPCFVEIPEGKYIHSFEGRTKSLIGIEVPAQ